MIKKIKELLVPIIIAIIAVLLMVWWVTIGEAHSNTVWMDAHGSGMIVMQEPCGLGYLVYTRPNGLTQPVLRDGHFHFLRDTHGIKNCDQLFIFLTTGERTGSNLGPVMTYNHPADKE